MTDARVVSLGARLGVFVCLTTSFLVAQDFRATIVGQVTDKSGASIPNAAIAATLSDTAETFSTTSNADGIYSLPFLNPGVYRVTAEAAGFKKLVRENVTLETAAKLSLNLVLDLGSLRQEVTVTAAPDIVESATGSGGTAFNPEETQNLPLNGRQVYMLLDLAPGVMFTQTQFGAQGFSGTRGWDVNSSYTINGGLTGLNQFLLNGAPISTSGTWQLAPSVDAIQEFKVMTNTYDAQYGRTGGGTVNTTLKSGSNAFHGTAFDYIRNQLLDANTYTNNLAGAPRSKHNVNQFGGTVGGPIRKGKTFVFGSFEGWRERVPFPVISSVPAAEMRPQADGSVQIIDRKHGGFDIFDPLSTRCTKTDPQSGLCTSYTRDQFKNNVIPANRISPIGRAILQLYPLPNAPGDQNNFFGTNNIGKYSYNQPMVRVDHVFNDANRMYSVFTWQRGHEDRNQNGFAPPIERGNIISERDNLNSIVDFTHVFSTSTLGDLRMSFARFHSNFPDGQRDFSFTADQLGLKMPNVPTVATQTAPMISVDRYASIIGNNFTDNIDNHFNLAPSVSQTRGHHTLHYGAEFAELQFADQGLGRPRGSFTFGTGFTQKDPRNRNNDGSGLADLFLGYPTGGSVDWNDTLFERWHYYAGYLQDDFRLRRNLTFNLGLRWETQTSITELHNRINGGFCYTCVNPLQSFPNLASDPRLIHPLEGGLLFAGVGGNPRTPYNTYLNYWQPRFGFAWAVSRKTVVRGGFGTYYAFANQHDTRTGFNQATSYVTSKDGDLTPNLDFAQGNPYPNGAAPPTGSSLGLLSSTGRGVSFDLANRRTPRVQQISFGIQRELAGHILLDIKYAHTFTDRLTVGTQWGGIPESLRALGQAEAANGGNSRTLDTQVPNPFFGILDVTSSLGHSPTIAAWRLMRPYPEFDGVTENTNPAGRSSYNALQVRTEKKVSGHAAGRGLTFVASYTYSKQFEEDKFLNNGNFRDDTLLRELASFDRTHNFAFSGVWNLPVGKGQPLASNATGVIGGVLNHWAFDWIFKDATGTPTGWPDADFTCATYRVVHPSFAEWFNNDQSCYHSRKSWTKRVVPDRFPWVRNPNEGQVSMALQKQFSMTESKRFQLRIEAFNAFNTPIFPGPDTNHNNKPTLASNGTWSGFGTVKLEQQNFPRNIQVSMKIIY